MKTQNLEALHSLRQTSHRLYNFFFDRLMKTDHRDKEKRARLTALFNRSCDLHDKYARLVLQCLDSAVLASTPLEPADCNKAVKSAQGATYYDECQHEYDRREICVLCGFNLEDIQDTDFIDAGISPAPYLLESPPLTAYQADYVSGFFDARVGG